MINRKTEQVDMFAICFITVAVFLVFLGLMCTFFRNGWFFFYFGIGSSLAGGFLCVMALPFTWRVSRDRFVRFMMVLCAILGFANATWIFAFKGI